MKENGKTVLWYADYDDGQRPVRTTADKPKYPNYDDDGRQIYENTHYRTEKEAWDYIMRNLEAGIGIAASRVKQAQSDLLKANEFAAKMAIQLSSGMDNYEAWKREQEKEPTNG